MILRDAHQSGHAIATTSQDEHALAGITNAATVGVLTEAIGVRMPDGWNCRGQETKVLWDAARWVRLADGVESIATPAWKRGSSHRESVEVTWALLQHVRTGLTLLRGGGHLPAHLFVRSQRVANETALNGLARVLEPLMAGHGPDTTTVSFDFNRALNTVSQRHVVGKAVEGTRLRLIVPPRPTLGRRTIDAFLTTGPLAQAAMLPRVRGYDHRGTVLATCGCPKQPKGN